MTKPEVHYLCQACGQDFPRWYGQCPSCGEWNSLIEELQTSKLKIQNKLQIPNTKAEKPISIIDVDFAKDERAKTGIDEIDRVLGGGIVGGSVILIAGEPGIGKSTLMLQMAEALSQQAVVLYVSGEESVRQIRLRAERLGTLSKNLMLLPETSIFAIEEQIGKIKPKFLMVDSIQTMYREDIAAAPGSVSQVREGANYLIRLAKTLGIPTFIVGHVTKEGNIAGPRVLEHMVDVVLYFEGEQYKQYRVLRVTKNRFGSTNEVGIFEMKEKGLVAMLNPSEVFLSERPKSAAGSVVTATLEGTRPLLVEIQALVCPTKMVYPARKSTGIDYNRASIIIAVLEKQLGLKLAMQDVYINAAGGVKVSEPAVDLPVALAIASSYKNKPVDDQTVIIGEVGLASEIRSVPQIEQRAKEAEKLGFKRMIIPKSNQKEVAKIKIEIFPVSSLKEAFNNTFAK